MADISKITPLGSSTTYDIKAISLKNTAVSTEAAAMPDTSDKTQTFRISSDSSGLANDGHIIGMTWNDASKYGAQLFIDTDPTYTMALRQRNSTGTWSAWKKIPMEDGTNASGTWGISITGNAATATSCSGNAATATKLAANGTTAQFYRGDQTWTNIFKQIGNTALGIDSNLKIGTLKRDLHFSVANGSGTGINDGNAAGITFGDDNSAYAGVYYQTSGSYGSRLHFATTNLYADGAKTRMIITHNGRVGIGTLTPDYALSVAGDVSATNFRGALIGNVTGNVSGSSGSCTGNAATATKLQTARTISLTGAVTGSGSFDGSANLSIATTVNHNHDSVYKKIQTAVSDPSASSTAIAFIDTISQNTQGVISATKKTVRDASFSQSGILSTGKQSIAGQKTIRYSTRIYPQLGVSNERSQWYKITFPYYNAETTTSAKWFMNSFDLHFGGGYNSNPNGVIHVIFYWTRAKENGAWTVNQVCAYGNGIFANKIILYYRIAEPGILYVNNAQNAYNGIWLDNLFVDDTAPSLDWSTTTIETCAAITSSTTPALSEYTVVPQSYLWTENGTALKTNNNIIPDVNNSRTLGTTDLKWKNVYATTFTGNLSGNASSASKANLTTTANAIAYYTDTAGTFGSKASANGALYATSANGALTFGTLPIAQGGTGKTTAAEAWTALGGGSVGKLNYNSGTTTYLRNDGTWATPAGDHKVTQGAAITTAGAYPIILATSTATTEQTNTVNKTSTLTYNPSTTKLHTPILEVTTASYGETLPSSGAAGQLFFQTSAEYYELPTGGSTGRLLMKRSTTDRDVQWTNNVYVSNDVLFGAAWNDYAEYRERLLNEFPKAGNCVIETGEDSLRLSTQRMQPGAEIVSDTFGFAIGKTNKATLPIAVSGRVLAYTYEDREEFKKNIGKPVCSGPNGTVSIMTDEEYRNYGYCAIGTISSVPSYETWGENNIKVDNRVWIKVR